VRAILFVELLGGIGDLLIALPAIQALGRSHPEAALRVLTFAPGAELLRHDPLVAETIVAASDGARRAVDDELARHRYDLIVSDTRYEGIATAIEASGAGRWVTDLWRHPPPHERVAGRFLAILLQEGVIASAAIAPPRLWLTSEEWDQAETALADCPRPRVVLWAEAGMPIKRWPAANFVALGRALRDRCAASLVVPIGDDAAGAGEIVAAIGAGARVLGRGPLPRFAAALGCCDIVVAADTMATHMAATLGVPAVTLFGPGWHGRYGQAPPHVNLQGWTACPLRDIADFTRQECWYSGRCPCGPAPVCMAATTPEQVLAAAVSLLEGG